MPGRVHSITPGARASRFGGRWSGLVGILVEVYEALRFCAGHVMTPEVQIPKLLTEEAVLLESSRGGRDRRVEKAKSPEFV
jgi:hypothetical protein